MTDKKSRTKRFFHSLYVRLILVIIAGASVGSMAFVLVRFVGNYYINNYYVAEEERRTREEKYIDDLRDYVKENEISSEDADRIAQWSQSNRYVYLLVYKNNELFFSSDMLPEKPKPEPAPDSQTPTSPEDGDEAEGGASDEGSSGEEDGKGKEDNTDKGDETDDGGSIGSGITVDYPKREELKKYAEENDLYELEMSDGVLFAAVAEFTEYLYYDLVNIISLMIAMIALSAILINYFRRIVARVKRLDRSVMAVAGGNINKPIETKKGYDEISRLSENVENMRCTILESIEDERRARQANTELITAMSHDIRTPLTVLLGYLDIMKSEATDEAMLSYVEASEKTAMRLKNLSDDMFNYFLAFGSSKENIASEEYDAATLFDQMLSEHLVLLDENGYNVVIEKRDIGFTNGATVVTDAPKLMRIIDNVFSNVMKYADKSKPVLIGVEFGSDAFTLEVKNTVRRIGAEVESNGIGLKTCQRLARLVADSFEFEEKNNLFTVKLKVKIVPPKATR